MPGPVDRAYPRRLAFSQLLLAPLAVSLLSCGGGDSPPTPPGEVGQTVRVTVATTGVSIDGDGYTVRLGTRAAPVAASGTAVFNDVSAGTYEVRLEGVAANCAVAGSAVASVSVSASSGAQSSFSVVCTADFADGLATVACTELSLAATSGAPLDRIAAGTVPSGLEAPLAARVMSPDGTALGYAWFEVDEQGRVELVTPLHPSGSIGGGAVLIRATDGNVACAPLEFTIEPLAASPGELGAVVDGLQDIVSRQAAVLQTTPAVLQSTALEDLDEVLLPLAIVQWVLDHPQNQSSLRRIADGTAPAAFPLEQTEALLARSGFRDSLALRLAASLRAPAPTSNSVDPSSCTPAAIGEDTQRLSDCMNAFAEIRELLEGLAERVGTRLGAAMLLRQKTGAAEPMQNVLAGLGWVAIQLELRSYALLPSMLFISSLSVTPERFLEDDPGTGTWSASVSAANRGWNLAVAEFYDLLFRSANQALQRVNADPLQFTTAVAELLIGPVTQHLPSLEIPNRIFGPVNVDDEMWSEVTTYSATSSSRPPPVEQVTHNTFRPIAVGDAILRLTVPPTSGAPKFGRTTDGVYRTITVDSLTVRVEPSDTLMAPGTTATFRFIVENAFSDSISVGAQQGTLSPPLTRTSKGQFTMSYTAPSNPNFNNPDIVDAIHESRTGARVNGPERRGTATVRFGKIEISPKPACLDTLEEQTFSAVVTGITDQDVEWITDAGTITQDGRYTAPRARPTGGYATIRATSSSEPALVGEVRVAIGCTCNYTFQLGTTTVVAEPGDRMVFNSFDNRLIRINVTRSSESWQLFMIPIDTAPAFRPNAPGPWPVRVQGDMGLTGPFDVIFSTDDEFAPLMNIEEYVPRDKVRGSVSGNVEVASTSVPRILPFSWWFSIRYAPGQFTCTVPDE